MYEPDMAEHRYWVQVGWLIAPLCATGAALAVAVSLFYRLGDAYVQQKVKAAQIRESRAGTVAWVPNDDGWLEPKLLTEQNRTIFVNKGAADQVEQISKSVVASPPVPHVQDINSLTVQLLRQASAVNDPNGIELPGWRQLPGWTSGKWQRAIKALRQAGLVASTSEQGTTLTKSLGEVSFDLEVGKIRLTDTQ